MSREARLKLLFEGDQALLDMYTHLNENPGTGAAEAASPAPVAVVSAAPQTQPQGPMVVPMDPSLSHPEPRLSYIRTGVIGQNAGDEDNQVIQPPQSVSSFSSAETKSRSKLESAAPPQEHHTPESSSQIDTSDVSLATSFCPANTMARFPYKYIRSDLSQSVASQFFDGNKFWNREWDLYYLNVPKEASNRALLLVPAIQAQNLLEEINKAHNCILSLTAKGQTGLLLPFDDVGTPQPVYLGRCSGRGKKDQLEGTLPPQPETWSNWLRGCDLSTADAFQDKIKAGISTTKSKNRGRGGKGRREQRRIESTQKWARYLRETKAHFGLQPSTEDGAVSSDVLPPVNVYEKSPWPFLDSPIFISVDVEWNERNPTQVTEVGISVLDTLDLNNMPPRDYGDFWRKQIKSKHLRVFENTHIVNREYCYGCPDQFDFGESEIVEHAFLGEAIDKCFSPPYMADITGDLPAYKNELRKIILVGHNPGHDISCLRDEGSWAFGDNLPSRILDTAELYRSLRGETELRSLRYILGGLGILALHLHNAGNDARFTMEALVRIVLDAAGERPGAYEKMTSQNMDVSE